jgi:hypothetical protein
MWKGGGIGLLRSCEGVWGMKDATRMRLKGLWAGVLDTVSAHFGLAKYGMLM